MSSTRTEPGAARRRTTGPVRRSVLLRYRVMAYVTGVLLIPLVFVATPLDLWGHTPGPAAVLGFMHGWLYVVYVAFAFELTVRLRYPLGRMLLVLLAGTVPFCSFIAERKVTRAWEANQRAAAGTRAGSADAAGSAGRAGAAGPAGSAGQ